ncbi:MAG TPA: sensor histidine kinase [Gaiellaceae bacterium]|nr:sensor histidine kinase [Gaiellaceae bacterium]
MSRSAQLARAYGFDALIVLAAIESALEVALREGPQAPTLTPWLAVPAIALVPLPLLARRRFPFAAPACVWLLAAALSFVDGELIGFAAGAFVSGLAATFLLGSLADTRQGRIGLVIAFVGAIVIVYNDPNHAPGDLIFTPVIFGIAWLAGFALRQRAEQAEAAEARAEQAEREREAAARIAVAEERARIARELHDIVAHAVSVMVLQVGAVRHQLPEALEEDKSALQGVERTGRAALTEMRRLLGAMRDDGQDAELTPQPGLDDLPALVAEVERAGLAVSLHLEGDRYPLPRAIDLSAYRIIQEGLTNVLKHADASTADVTVEFEPAELAIEVRDDGRGSSSSDGAGHGLVGIRERVKIYGGEMVARPSPTGGFVLAVRLPVRGDNGS